ncbi:MAG: hypothetical protein EZS28_013456 [Streblomastix strix]|uniref:Uncharacterized protein n=1 Tax=Streblomastix strix TaxID=222440 RepID=A0A5J4W9I2_9EUKA|nr:MAG: hypothetical protein EZS28_013456 [Streblomastix strix]
MYLIRFCASWIRKSFHDNENTTATHHLGMVGSRQLNPARAFIIMDISHPLFFKRQASASICEMRNPIMGLTQGGSGDDLNKYANDIAADYCIDRVRLSMKSYQSYSIPPNLLCFNKIQREYYVELKLISEAAPSDSILIKAIITYYYKELSYDYGFYQRR